MPAPKHSRKELAGRASALGLFLWPRPEGDGYDLFELDANGKPDFPNALTDSPLAIGEVAAFIDGVEFALADATESQPNAFREDNDADDD